MDNSLFQVEHEKQVTSILNIRTPIIIWHVSNYWSLKFSNYLTFFSPLLLSLLFWLWLLPNMPLPQHTGQLQSMPLPQLMLQHQLMPQLQPMLMFPQHMTTHMLLLMTTRVLTLEPMRTVMGKNLKKKKKSINQEKLRKYSTRLIACNKNKAGYTMFVKRISDTLKDHTETYRQSLVKIKLSNFTLCV